MLVSILKFIMLMNVILDDVILDEVVFPGIDHKPLKRGLAGAVRKRSEPSTPPAASTGPTAASGVDVAQLGVRN